MQVPLALFAFRRPGHLHRLCRSLHQCHGRDKVRTIIFCDGPRGIRDWPGVLASRMVAQVWAARWQAQIRRSSMNQGLHRSILTGVDYCLEQSDRVIVLEDDLELAPGFLDFMLQGLHAYADTDRVGQISGYSTLRRPEPSCFFLPVTTTWGWGTWKRIWENFRKFPPSGDEILCDPDLIRAFDLDGAYSYSRILREQVSRTVSSWGIHYYARQFLDGRLTLYPPEPQVENFGFDGSGTHGGLRRAAQSLSRDTDRKHWNYPDQPEVDQAALDEWTKRIRR